MDKKWKKIIKHRKTIMKCAVVLIFLVGVCTIAKMQRFSYTFEGTGKVGEEVSISGVLTQFPWGGDYMRGNIITAEGNYKIKNCTRDTLRNLYSLELFSASEQESAGYAFLMGNILDDTISSLHIYLAKQEDGETVIKTINALELQ